MKVAVITDDGVTVSQHFGRAPYYVVATIVDGKVESKQTRDKTGHHTFAGGNEDHEDAQGRHGYGHSAERKHASMAEAIRDCNVLISGGMGWGAYESMRSYNIETIVTNEESIDKAIELYLAGNLPNLMDRLH